MRDVLFSLVGIGLAFASAACSSSESCPADPPQITSFTVTPTSVVAGGELSGSVEVANFEFGAHDEAAGAHDEDAECPGGHAHIYLDDLMTNPLAMPETTPFTFTIPAGTSAGSHTLIARLQNHDHTILKPEVTAEATIMVEGGGGGAGGAGGAGVGGAGGSGGN